MDLGPIMVVQYLTTRGKLCSFFKDFRGCVFYCNVYIPCWNPKLGHITHCAKINRHGT